MRGNRPPHNDSDTSRAAAESMEGAAPRLRERVFRHIKRAGPHGATCHEVERYLKLRHQTASARIWELHQKNRVKDSGYRRSTPSGRLAIVWVESGRPETEMGPARSCVAALKEARSRIEELEGVNRRLRGMNLRLRADLDKARADKQHLKAELLSAHREAENARSYNRFRSR